MERTKVSLFILDGWGLGEPGKHNAISCANTPYWDKLVADYPMTKLSAHGEQVGLTPGTMGNSEVGHLNIGAGRVVYQDSLKVSKSIQEKSFFENEVLLEALDRAKGSTLHVLGLLSPGYIHSHQDHIFALLKAAHSKNLTNVVLHAFLDGRDTPPKSAAESITKAEKILKEYNMLGIGTVAGRFYAMDRDKRRERTEAAYNALIGKCENKAENALEALEKAYNKNLTDEFVEPTICLEKPITDGDVVVFMNFRADRARQITRALVMKDFNDFNREKKDIHFYSLTPYASDIKTPAFFTPEPVTDGLGETLSKAGLSQLRLAETEKYAHVTYFFNGGVEKAFDKEERILCPSPKVTTYDLAPRMSIDDIAAKYIENVDKFDVCIVNFANADMVGHTGNFAATVEAIEAVDEVLSKTIPAAAKAGHTVLITADHGNADKMYDSSTKQAHTAHSTNPVPLLVTNKEIKLKQGSLCNVAPTILKLLHLDKPQSMSEEALF